MDDNKECLASKQCIPCNKGGVALDCEAIPKLLSKLDNWKVNDEGNWLEKTFKFKNFTQALHFINQVGAIAESQNHHPDITLGWGYAGIKLQTHAISGLHENDFIVAAKIDRLTF